jgi:hypothetical protein
MVWPIDSQAAIRLVVLHPQLAGYRKRFSCLRPTASIDIPGAQGLDVRGARPLDPQREPQSTDGRMDTVFKLNHCIIRPESF